MDKFESLLDRLERVTQSLELAAGDKAGHPKQQSNGDIVVNDSPVVKGFDEIIAGPLSAFLKESSKIGGDVDQQARLVQKCFQTQRRFLELTVTHSKPSEGDLREIIQACLEPVGAVLKFKDSHRSSSYFNHLSAVAESVAALGWINTPGPAPYIKEMQDAGQFFTNRVIKEYKEKDSVHIAWTKALANVWTSLFDYVKQRHTAGILWNSRGSTAQPSAMMPVSCASIPPPPPPMPAPLSSSYEVEDDSANRSALFAQLNRGEAVTAGLRKVTDDMKTHKNPKLREAPPLQSQTGAPLKPPKPTKLTGEPAKKAGLLELNGNKWTVENFDNEQLTIDKTEQKHSVYIYKCTGCTVIIKGKINSVSVDNCKKTGVLFEHLISSIDVVNCQSVSVQTTGTLQTINIDKTDGCQIYLSSDSKSADVITAKSSAVNVLIPKGDGDFDEYPVPEQFKTNFTGRGLVTKCNESI
jgi:adenylyl cyclase-associated protein